MPRDTGFPLTEERLEEIASQACKDALIDAKVYTHSSTQAWNNEIINSIIEALVTATSPTEVPDMSSNPYKFVVNSTIIQNTPAGEPGKSKRGMNSSVGAFWNSSKDGMWSYKYDAGSTLGMDVVLSVIWVALDKQP